MMARLPGFRALHGRPCQVATWLLVVGVGAGGELPVERCDVDGSLTSGLLLLHFRTGGRFSSRSSRVGSTRSSEEGSPRSAREATSSDGGGAAAGGASGAWIGTFHAMCARILRREIEEVRAIVHGPEGPSQNPQDYVISEGS